MSAITSFDLTKPVQTTNGYPARILCTDRKPSGINYGPVVFLYTQDGAESQGSCNLDGSACNGYGCGLVNTPEIKRVYFLQDKLLKQITPNLTKVVGDNRYWENLGYIDVDLSTLKPVE